MAPFWSTPVPEDDVLARQLAHLEALERREVSRRPQSGGEPDDAVIEPLAVPALWPASIPEAPAPGAGGTSLAPLLAWLDLACAVLETRVARHQAERERLGSQWTHVLRNLDRLRPEEINAVAEGQARMREGIASDAALHDVLRRQRAHLAAWAEALDSPLTDPTLVRRLLDDAAAERAQITEQVVRTAVDALASVALDFEVLERHLRHDPAQAPGVLDGLRGRVSATVEKLLDVPGVEAVHRPGEPLLASLQRIGERHGGRLHLTWSGSDLRDGDACAAVAWVLHECLGHLARVPEAILETAVEVGASGMVAVRFATAGAALLPDGDPAWLVRSRARVALAHGRLLCGQAGAGSFVEVRFS